MLSLGWMGAAADGPGCEDVVSPFARLNLRWNPFGEPPEEDLPGLVVADVDGMVEWLAGPHRALQLIGACGRGKTARLQALRPSFPSVPYIYLAEGEAVPPLPEGPRLFLDEAQRLPWRRRRRLFRRLEAVAVATHVDLARELRAAGLEVRTIIVAGLDEEELLAILERRVEWARLGPGAVPWVDRSGAKRLIERLDDDLRAMIDHLYEIVQGLDEVGEIRP